MGSTTFARGPGGQEFFSALGDVWMVYHGWARGQAGSPDGERRLYVDIVRVHDGVPERVGGRSLATRAGPGGGGGGAAGRPGHLVVAQAADAGPGRGAPRC